MNLTSIKQRIEALEKKVSLKQEKFIAPAEICAMEAVYNRIKDMLNTVEQPDMAETIGSFIASCRRDKNLGVATCPEYEQMSEDERDRLGQEWIDRIVEVVRDIDSLKR